MKRQYSRIISVLLLYNYDINPGTTLEAINDNVLAMIKDYFDDPLDEQTLSFFQELTHGTLFKLEEIDRIIINNLYNWSLDRLSYVDRAIIRLACYEMLYTSTPVNIIIDEALEITKVLSEIEDNQQVKFTNKLLDKIKDEIANAKE